MLFPVVCLERTKHSTLDILIVLISHEAGSEYAYGSCTLAQHLIRRPTFDPTEEWQMIELEEK